MVGYLGFDGFTSTWQDRMFKGYQMSVYSQILYVQAYSAGVSLISLLAFGQVRFLLDFCTHPKVLLHGLAGALCKQRNLFNENTSAPDLCICIGPPDTLHSCPKICLLTRLVNYECNSITTKSYIWDRYAIFEHA
jgi:hypothetical protein